MVSVLALHHSLLTDLDKLIDQLCDILVISPSFCLSLFVRTCVLLVEHSSTSAENSRKKCALHKYVEMFFFFFFCPPRPVLFVPPKRFLRPNGPAAAPARPGRSSYGCVLFPAAGRGGNGGVQDVRGHVGDRRSLPDRRVFLYSRIRCAWCPDGPPVSMFLAFNHAPPPSPPPRCRRLLTFNHAPPRTPGVDVSLHSITDPPPPVSIGVCFTFNRDRGVRICSAAPIAAALPSRSAGTQ